MQPATGFITIVTENAWKNLGQLSSTLPNSIGTLWIFGFLTDTYQCMYHISLKLQRHTHSKAKGLPRPCPYALHKFLDPPLSLCLFSFSNTFSVSNTNRVSIQWLGSMFTTTRFASRRKQACRDRAAPEMAVSSSRGHDRNKKQFARICKYE